MQKPKFRTAEKSAWLFVTTRLHPQKPRKMNRRTAVRCGYLPTAANRTGLAESALKAPFAGEPMSAYIARIKAPAAG